MSPVGRAKRALRSPSLRLAACLAVALAVGGAAPIAQGEVYKCTDAAGKTTYSDAPCARGSKPLNIPDPTPAVAADSTMCAQLQDEINRLAATESGKTGPSKRRVALHKQYESRCVGISRSPPPKR